MVWYSVHVVAVWSTLPFAYSGIQDVDVDVDSTPPFANGYGGHPLSWLCLPLEGGHSLFSQIEKGRKVEGS